MTEPLAPQYNPSAIESALYAWWQERGLFTPDAGPGGAAATPYVIMMPPPNVTAVLHMGHGLNNTVQDVLVRFERMRGRRALWLPGTDHAGIATQNVVERLLAKEGLTRFDVGRDAFVERVWAHVRETGAAILEQLKAIGCSADWTRTYFTLDDDLSRAVREAFVTLYEQGLVYRGHYIINWCPRCLTALSNEEAEKEETDGKLWHLRYPLADGSGHVTVATTRPETMLGDTAVAVHPEDERYRHLVGHEVMLPVVDRPIPIVADDAVDPAFGSGAVKVTPAHDPDRLRDRPAARPARRRRHDARGAHQPGGARPVPGARPVRGPHGGSWPSSRRPGCWRRWSPTATPSATATAATRWWSRGSPTSGSSGWRRSRVRRSRSTATARCGSFPSAAATTTPSGSRASATGASPASSGGATAFRCGTARTRAAAAPR